MVELLNTHTHTHTHKRIGPVAYDITLYWRFARTSMSSMSYIDQYDVVVWKPCGKWHGLAGASCLLLGTPVDS